MEGEIKKSFFSRSLLAGVFSGIVAVILLVAYNYLYRAITGYRMDQLFNMFFITLSSMLILVIAGIVFSQMVKIENGKNIYRIVFAVLTIAAVVVGFFMNRGHTEATEQQFGGLFAGASIIWGALAIFLLPYMASHENKIF